ncbi:MAG: hypothetical protein U0528_14630 [Anaerolineae bacterium]
MAKKMMKAEFNLEDLSARCRASRRCGPLSGLIMIPGLNRFKDQIEQANPEEQFKKIEAIIRSMTPRDRRNPDTLNASRKKRIARGAGYVNTEKAPQRELEGVQEINQLMKQFREMQKMMKGLRSGRIPPGLMGGR